MSVATLQTLLRGAAYLQVRREADRLLLDGALTDRERGQVLRLACRAAAGLSDWYAAVHLGQQAIDLAALAGDTETLGRAHFDVGTASTHIGDTHAGEHHLQEFLRLSPGMTGVELWEGMAHYNLSVICRQRWQWAEAIQVLDRAGALFERNGQTAGCAQVSLDMAWCHCMLGDAGSARPHLAQLEEYLGTHHDDTLAADLLCARALLTRVEGDLAGSTRTCIEVFLPNRPGVTAHHLGEAAWIMGENALDLGRTEEAMAFASVALDYAARDNWPSLMNLAGDLRRRIASLTTTGG